MTVEYSDATIKNAICHLHFVRVFPIIIISLNNSDQLEMGYLMEIVPGITIRNLKSQDREYFIINKNMIQNALEVLIKELTKINFLVVDLNDDNIMWDKTTNTLTYIDIDTSSFTRQSEVNLNELIDISNLFLL